jgi:hypothetical protein
MIKQLDIHNLFVKIYKVITIKNLSLIGKNFFFDKILDRYYKVIILNTLYNKIRIKYCYNKEKK